VTRASLACVLLAACSRCPDVTVFAASSTTEVMEEIADLFPGRVSVSVAASSTLARQIEQGAPADVYVSADEEWMDYLEERGLIVGNSRVDLLTSTLVLVAPASPGTRVEIGPGLADLEGDPLIAMGDPDHVPAGRYGKAALEHFGIWAALEGRIARAGNVRAALALVERSEVPFGIVYSTDAAVSSKVAIAGTFPAGSHPPIVYPAAIVAGHDTPAAHRMLEILEGPEARAIFTSHGFGAP